MHLHSSSEPRLLLTQRQTNHEKRILHGSHHVLDLHGSHCSCAVRCRLVLLLGPHHRVSEGLQGQYFYEKRERTGHTSARLSSPAFIASSSPNSTYAILRSRPPTGPGKFTRVI